MSGYYIDDPRLRELHLPPDPDAPPPFKSALDFIKNYQPPAYVVDGVIQAQRVYTLTAPTGKGKTAVAMTIGAHVATGRTLGGRRVKQGNVVYFAAENPDDVRARLIFTCHRLGIDPSSLCMYFVERSFDIDRWFDTVANAVDNIGGARLVITDTGPAFIAAIGIDDENSNMAMLRFALAMRRITELRGSPSHLVLTHPVKNAQSKEQLLPRGGGALLAEVDGNLCIELDADTKIATLHWTGKLRGPDFEPITFRLETGTCPQLVDAEGRKIYSVCAVPVEDAEIEEAGRQRTEEENALLVAMLRKPGASFAEYAEMLGWFDSSGKPAKWRVQRRLQKLEVERMVRRVRNRVELTREGKAEAERLA